ncbi:hypothetical protein CYY_003886 [Polysphondylium violaceum]|uniref:DUF221 family protein n=1 Tax=Polysphondylium violaceum TaxID=133409 RepID=A0A8J4V5N6_9MYCE|nr:hypothetical protein CYY_003886 [Polysphondylium violaceum]
MSNRYQVQDSAFVVTLVINTVISILSLLIFCFIRTKFKKFYQYRYETNQRGVEISPRTGFFAWIRDTLNYDNEKIIQTSGLDAYMFLRNVKTNILICGTLMVLGAIMLYPTNAVGKYNENRPNDDEGNPVDPIVGLATISMGNIERESNLLWVHTVFTFIVTAVVCFFSYGDYSEYAKRRVQFKKENRLLNHSILIKDINESSFKLDAMKQVMNSYLPNNGLKDVALYYPSPIALKLVSQREVFVKKLERALFDQKKPGSKPPMVKTGFLGCVGEKRPAIEFYSEKIADLTKQIETERQASEQQMPAARAAFVVFNQKQSAKQFVQTIMDPNYPCEFGTHYAPDPNDVFWSNVSIGCKSFFIRSLIVGVFIFFLTFFWAVPVTFLSGFSNLGTLAKVSAFSWLVDIINKSSVLAGFLQGFLPNLVLIIFMALLVPIITAVSKAQGFHSNSEIDESVFSKYFLFLVFNVFLVSAIAGSIFQSIESIAKDPSSIVGQIANSLGGLSFQMINFVMIAAAASLGKIGRFIPLLIRQLKLRFFSKTKREREATKKCGAFGYSTSYAFNILVLQLCLAYCTLSPFIAIFGVWFFGATYLVSKYNIIWVNTPSYQGGGILYPLSFRRTLVGLLIYHILMIGSFNLYGFYFGNLTVIPLVFTILYWVYCETQFHSKSQNGILDKYENAEEQPILEDGGVGSFADTTVAFTEYNGLQYKSPVYQPLMEPDESNGEQGNSSV